VFVLPKAKVLDSSARVPGTDGEKMSKSYNNTLAVFDDAKAQKKLIMRIATDSRPMEDPKDPTNDVLYMLYSLVATETDRNEMAELYAKGGFGYGDVKKKLAEAAEAYFADARTRRTDWENRPDDVRDILAVGAVKARKKAAEVLARAQQACGLKGY
jgi:tryptophanyl-tRNA synthetase